MSDELKPCPFCQTSPKEYDTRDRYNPFLAGIKCQKCAYEILAGTGDDLESPEAKEQARELCRRIWNTRPLEDALRAENAKLHEHIADLYAAIRQDGEERGTVIFERNLLQLEVNKLKARVEAAEELIEAQEEFDATVGNPGCWCDKAEYELDLAKSMARLQTARENWEALK